MSCSKPAELVESALGYAGKVEDVAFKPWASSGAWQVSGLLHFGKGSSDVSGPPGRAPMPADGVCRTDLRKRARALCRSAANGAEIANTTDDEEEAEDGEDEEEEEEEEDATLNSRHRRVRNNGGRGGHGGCGDDDGDHNTHTDDADDSDPDGDYCDHGPEDSTTARSTAHPS